MRFSIRLAFLLLFLPSIQGLSDFGHYFPEDDPNYLAYALPFSCPATELNFELMDNLIVSKSSSGIISNFDYASEKIKFLKMLSSNKLSTIGGIFPGSLVSIACAHLITSAKNHAASALRASLNDLDEAGSMLDLLAGSEGIFTFGLLEEKQRVEQEILARSPTSNFPMRLLNAANSFSKAKYYSFLGNENIGALQNIIGKRGALEESIIFTTKLTDSIFLLNSGHLNLSRAYPEILFLAKKELSQLIADDLNALDESALNDIIDSENMNLHIFDTLREFENSRDEAIELHLLSEKALSSKDRGYLAYSFLMLQKSLLILERLLISIESLNEKTIQLNDLLFENSLALEKNAKGLIETKNKDPLVHDYLKSKWGKYQILKKQSISASTRGKKINAYLAQILLLNEIISASENTDFNAYMLSLQKTNAKRLTQLLASGKAQGLDLAEENAILEAIKTPLANFDLDSDPSQLISIEGKLGEIENSLLEKARQRFSILEESYLQLQKMRKYLSLQDQLKLDSYSGLFQGGKLNFLQALPDLSQMELFCQKTALNFEEKKPQIIMDALQNSLIITEISIPSELDIPQTITAHISLENQLDFDISGGQIKTSLPMDAKLINSSNGIKEIPKDGAIYLRIISTQEKYFATFEYEFTPNKLTSKKTTVLDATFEHLLVSSEFVFQTSKKSSALVNLPLLSDIHSLDYNSAYDSKIDGSNLILILDAPIGKNTLRVRFDIPNPFSLAIVDGKSDKTYADYSFEYINQKLDIPFSEIEFSRQTACEINKVVVQQTNFEFTDLSKGNFLSFKLKTKDWALGEKKTISLRLICDNAISDIFLESYNSTHANTLIDQLALESSKQDYSLGNFGVALKTLNQLQLNYDNKSSGQLAIRINSLQAAINSCLANNYEVAFASEINSDLIAATNAQSSRDNPTAQSLVDQAEKKLDDFLSLKQTYFKKSCSSGCNGASLAVLGRFSISLISKDYPEAINSAIEFEGELAQLTLAASVILGEKLDAISGFDAFLEESQSALLDFEIYFFANEKTQTELKSNPQYRDATSAKATLEKTTNSLLDMKNSLDTNNSGKYSADLMLSKMAQANGALELLVSSNAKIKELAETEYKELQARQKQFGNDKTKSALDEVTSEIDLGHYFTAYALAKSANSDFMAPKSAASEDKTPYLIPALLVLLGLAYYLFFMKKDNAIILAAKSD